MRAFEQTARVEGSAPAGRRSRASGRRARAFPAEGREPPARGAVSPDVKSVRVHGACLEGTGAEPALVEARFEPADIKRTDIHVTGLPDAVVREARGRVSCALAESGLRLPFGRLYWNLVPAARKKRGDALDLPLALAAAAACGHLDPRWLRGALFYGSLGIDGRLHAVPGGLAAGLVARGLGLDALIGARAAAEEAACVPGLRALPARHLASVVAHLSQAGPPLEPLDAPDEGDAAPADRPEALDEVRGHALAKRALAVAAAGAHGLLFIGPPGAGKSMLARRMLGLLPPPSFEERLEIGRVLSAAGMWPGRLVRRRPFRAPHHSASTAGLVGGGTRLAPGEISLAHRGLLFLDELPEFKRDTLESLRQPLERGSITISRATGRVRLPARFQLVAAMNPCPCGHRGHGRVPCRCSAREIDRYRHRLSGPLLDRVDLRLELRPPPLDELTGARAAPPSTSGAALARAANDARGRALARRGKPNAALDADELDEDAPLDREGRALLRRAAAERDLSARALQSLRRVARTLADFAGEPTVSPTHLAEALALRAPWP